MNKKSLLDRIGIIVEDYLIVGFNIICIMSLLVILIQVTILKENSGGVLNTLSSFFEVLIAPNIGNLMTIAAVFIGFYFTILSIFGGVKLNSIIAVLAEDNIKRILKYIRDALVFSFLFLFFAIFIPIITNHCLKVFMSFYLLSLMLITALRFGLIMMAIFYRDLSKLKSDLEEQRREKDQFDSILGKLRVFLEDYEVEKAQKATIRMNELLQKKKADKEKGQKD